MKWAGIRTCAALIAAGGTLVAYHFTKAPVVENLVALRLPGKWTLDQEISNRLDSARVTPAPKTVEFTSDEKTLAKVKEGSTRWNDEVVYLSGTAKIEGEEDRLFLLVCHDGNPLVVFLNASEPVAEVRSMNVGVALAREPAKDVLLLGGYVLRESAAAYGRAGQ